MKIPLNKLDDPSFDGWVCDVCGKFMEDDSPCIHCGTVPPWWEADEWEDEDIDPKEYNHGT